MIYRTPCKIEHSNYTDCNRFRPRLSRSIDSSRHPVAPRHPFSDFRRNRRPAESTPPPRKRSFVCDTPAAPSLSLGDFQSIPCLTLINNLHSSKRSSRITVFAFHPAKSYSFQVKTAQTTKDVNFPSKNAKRWTLAGGISLISNPDPLKNSWKEKGNIRGRAFREIASIDDFRAWIARKLRHPVYPRALWIQRLERRCDYRWRLCAINTGDNASGIKDRGL